MPLFPDGIGGIFASLFAKLLYRPAAPDTASFGSGVPGRVPLKFPALPGTSPLWPGKERR